MNHYQRPILRNQHGWTKIPDTATTNDERSHKHHSQRRHFHINNKTDYIEPTAVSLGEKW